MDEKMGEHDFGDFFSREFSDFAEDGPVGGPTGGMGGPPGPFRGRGGGPPWRGRGRGGHFNDNGFGPRGPPRFRGGRGGFMGPPMRGGPGPRGPPGPGFRGGHFERPFRPHGGWNGPPGQMGHGGGGDQDFMGPNEGGESQDVIWAETKSETGVYYYNTKTRATSWEKPEGNGIKIMSHEEWSGMMTMKPGGGPPGNDRSRFGDPDSQNSQNSGFSGQGPPQGPMGGGFGPRPQGPNMGGPMLGPPNQVRPPLNMGGPPNSVNPFTAALGQSQFRHPAGPNPGENGFSSIKEENDDGVPKGSPVAPQQRPPVNQQQGPPGFPSFPMSGGPPFFPQNFPMVPPPWNPMSGVPPPTGVPPPMMNPGDPALQHVDPQLVARAFEWTEHVAPDGKLYYFHAKTQNSVWEKPQPILEFETAKIIAQQRLMQQAMMNAAKDKLGDQSSSIGDYAKSKDAEARKAAAANDKGRPVSSTPVSGTPWCIVWTGDKRVFFYNPSTKTSVWERPPDLHGRMDIEELLKNVPAIKNLLPLANVKKAEATSTTESANNANNANAAPNLVPNPNVSNPNSEIAPAVAVNNETQSSTTKPEFLRMDTKIIINLEKRGRDRDDSSNASGAPPEKKAKTVEAKSENGDNTEVITIEDDEKAEETKAAFQEKNALEAEVLAARERAIVPLETRLQQFREMLVEKQVSAFSVWEKELHKIVFDSRYLLLTSKERKTAFENYVKERAEEERKEKKTRLKVLKEKFIQFLEDVNVPPKMSYNEFSQRFGRDERYRIVEKSRDRESYFTEYQVELKRKDKESKSHKKDKAKEEFQTLLKEKVKDYHLKWMDVRKRFDESRFDILESEEKEELFRMYQKKLKAEIKYKEKKKKKKLKKQKREKARLLRIRTESKSERELGDEERADGESDGHESNKSGDQGELESDKMEDISEEEEKEEGAISDDSDEDQDDLIEQARKERAEISMREREREVQRTLATHLRDRDKEREFYRHEEAVQDFQALLTDGVRTSDIPWRDAKKTLKRDRRWESVSILSREEMEDMFNQHCENVARKKKLRFRDLLVEARVKLNAHWKDVRKKIRDDPRFQKYSVDERKCEREFSLYLKDLATQMKSEFRALLKETKMLNYKSKQQIRENPQILKDVEALLEKDKRFLNLDCMADERHRLLVEYLDELERKGPPPPPTASEPSRRLK